MTAADPNVIREALTLANGCRGELWKSETTFADALAALAVLEQQLRDAERERDEARALAETYRAGAALAYRQTGRLRALEAIVREYDEALAQERHTSEPLSSADYVDLRFRAQNLLDGDAC